MTAETLSTSSPQLVPFLVPEVENLKKIPFEKFVADIKYQILDRMDIETVNQMRLTSKAVNEYVDSVAPFLSPMKHIDHMFYTERGLRWQYKRPFAIMHGSCPVDEMKRRIHGVNVETFLIDQSLDDTLVRCISRARIRVGNLNLAVQSDIQLVNQLVAAVRPASLNYDVSIHDDTKEHYTDDGRLPGTSLDITGLLIPSYVHSLLFRAETITGFELKLIPPTVKNLITHAHIEDSIANNCVKAWQESRRNIQRYVLTAGDPEADEIDFSVEKALETTDAKTLYPQFLGHYGFPTFAVDRSKQQSLVVIVGEDISNVVLLGPGHSANTLFKDQRTDNR